MPASAPRPDLSVRSSTAPPVAGRRAAGPAAVLALLLAAGGGGLAACGGGGSAQGAGDVELFVTACSLGCDALGAEEDAQVGCGVSSIGANEEIAIEFSAPVDPASVSGESLQVTELASGATPSGVFRVDPGNPRRVLYRPALTFDSQGLPVFGLVPGESYRVVVPGTAQDPGDPSRFVRSTTGRPNRSRLACTVVASEVLADVVPGAPTVSVLVDRVAALDPATGEPAAFEEGVLANGGVLVDDVFRRSRIVLEFDDVMNPATLLNPFTGEVAFLSVSIDPDGVLGDGSQRVPVEGTWQLALDQTARRTTVVFDPAQDLPSAGTGEPPRLVVVELPEEVRDLGGNALANGGLVGLVPERRSFAPVLLPGQGGEDFSTTERLDARRSGALWGPAGLAPGPGGGSGRHGELEVELADGLVVLDTDEALVQGPDVLGAFDPITGAHLDEVGVEGGVFEFSSLRVGPGAILRLRGSRPARLYVRGEATVDGTIDLAADDAPLHPSMPCDPLVDLGPGLCVPALLTDDAFRGGPGAAGGPGGSPGGRGADLPGSDPTLVAVGGLESPLPVPEPDGRAGVGVLDPATGLPDPDTGGAGGSRWPLDLPDEVTDVGGLGWGFFECGAYMLGAAGGGGGYGTNGGEGTNGRLNYVVILPDLAPAAPGGAPVDWSPVAPGPEPRSLDPELGYLRGGSGGGGGGAHAGDSVSDQTPVTCNLATALTLYRPSAGAGGGGGGGALQVQAGRRLVVSGRLDARGGDGGGAVEEGVDPEDRDALDRASPGGGGSGGALLLQAPEVVVAPFEDVLRVDGGRGGQGVPDPFPGDGLPLATIGGRGGAGAVRVEGAGLDAQQLAEALSPDPDELAELGALAEDVLSIAPFPVQTTGPGRTSGAQSCWFSAEEVPFLLRPAPDGAVGLGWDLSVFVAGVGPVSWRTPGALFPEASLEELLGSELGTSPLVVRFQGARAVEPLGDPCEVPAEGPESPFLPGSLSPWVAHPAAIEALADDAAQLPTHLRFQVLFDRTSELSPFLLGVTELWIRAAPD